MGSKEEIQDWMLSVGIISPVTKESTGALYHQQLSCKTSLIAEMSPIPTEVDKLTVDTSDEDNKFVIKAFLCCEDRMSNQLYKDQEFGCQLREVQLRVQSDFRVPLGHARKGEARREEAIAELEIKKGKGVYVGAEDEDNHQTGPEDDDLEDMWKEITMALECSKKNI